MEKDFFDVFPHLKVNEKLEELLDMVSVTKVSCNPAKTHIRVYVKSERWIHKKHLFELEKEIERQCFPGIVITVTVIEKFSLSRQYTPKNFLEAYKGSMELELRNYNMLEYNLFKRSHIEFPDDNTLRMVLPDSVIAREKSEILVEYLHKVFCERCGMDLKVEMEFEETEESKYRKNAVLQIQQEVENVLKNAGTGKSGRGRKEKGKIFGKRRQKGENLRQSGEKDLRKERTKRRVPRRIPKGQQSGCYLWKRFRRRSHSAGIYHRRDGRSHYPGEGS